MTGPCLTAELAAIHKSVAEYVREFDYKYQTNDRDNTSIGCDNYYSVEFDETADTTDGYDGINRYSNEVFSALPNTVCRQTRPWCCLHGPRTGTGWLCST